MIQTLARDLEPVGLALFAIYLAVAGAWDLKTRRVPNFLTLPGMGIVLLGRVIRIGLQIHAGVLAQAEMAFIFYWAGIWILWNAGLMGGGDAKLLMVLLGIFPTLEFLTLLLAVSGLTMAAVLVWRYARRKRLGIFIKGFFTRLTHGRIFPTNAELDAMGEPTAFLFAAAGMIEIILLSL